jgi:hypothetical protein
MYFSLSVGGGYRGIEDGAQQGTSVGHHFPAVRMRNMGCRLSIRLPQKKTPAQRAGVQQIYRGS